MRVRCCCVIAMKKAHQAARRLQAGTVWINTYGMFDVAVPFGGRKQSGFGKEHGVEAIESYTEKKSVVLGSG